MADTVVTPGDVGDLDAICRLLAASGLPTQDLSAEAAPAFLVVRRGTGIVGCVAVERCGEFGLLRSLAVAVSERGKGLGDRLAAEAEQLARQVGIARLYLLTMTATAFFEHRGYRLTDRAEAPEAIARSTQFSGLCPGSSSFMSKPLPQAKGAR